MLLIENPKYIQYDKSILSQLPDMGYERHMSNDCKMRNIAIRESKIAENTFPGSWWKSDVQVMYLYDDWNEKHRAGASIVYVPQKSEFWNKGKPLGGSPIFVQEYTHIRLYRSIFIDINCRNSDNIVGLPCARSGNPNVFIESVGNPSREGDIETITLPDGNSLIIDYSRRNAYGEYYAHIISK